MNGEKHRNKKTQQKMKKTIGNGLILFGIADAVYLYGAGLTGKMVIFSVPFLELLALFIVANFVAVMLLSSHAEPLPVRRADITHWQRRVTFLR